MFWFNFLGLGFALVLGFAELYPTYNDRSPHDSSVLVFLIFNSSIIS
jgi:hypothetical protein